MHFIAEMSCRDAGFSECQVDEIFELYIKAILQCPEMILEFTIKITGEQPTETEMASKYGASFTTRNKYK